MRGSLDLDAVIIVVIARPHPRQRILILAEFHRGHDQVLDGPEGPHARYHRSRRLRDRDSGHPVSGHRLVAAVVRPPKRANKTMNTATSTTAEIHTMGNANVIAPLASKAKGGYS